MKNNPAQWTRWLCGLFGMLFLWGCVPTTPSAVLPTESGPFVAGQYTGQIVMTYKFLLNGQSYKDDQTVTIRDTLTVNNQGKILIDGKVLAPGVTISRNGNGRLTTLTYTSVDYGSGSLTAQSNSTASETLQTQTLTLTGTGTDVYYQRDNNTIEVSGDFQLSVPFTVEGKTFTLSMYGTMSGTYTK
jgi:hypothetical protein